MSEQPNIDELLNDYLEGMVDPARAREVEALLAGDPQKRQLLVELQALRQSVRQLPRESLPASASQAIQDHLAAPAPLPLFAPVRLLRIAAILLLTLGGGLLIYTLLPHPDQHPQALALKSPAPSAAVAERRVSDAEPAPAEAAAPAAKGMALKEPAAPAGAAEDKQLTDAEPAPAMVAPVGKDRRDVGFGYATKSEKMVTKELPAQPNAPESSNATGGLRQPGGMPGMPMPPGMAGMPPRMAGMPPGAAGGAGPGAGMPSALPTSPAAPVAAAAAHPAAGVGIAADSLASSDKDKVPSPAQLNIPTTNLPVAQQQVAKLLLAQQVAVNTRPTNARQAYVATTQDSFYQAQNQGLAANQAPQQSGVQILVRNLSPSQFAILNSQLTQLAAPSPNSRGEQLDRTTQQSTRFSAPATARQAAANSDLLIILEPQLPQSATPATLPTNR